VHYYSGLGGLGGLGGWRIARSRFNPRFIGEFEVLQQGTPAIFHWSYQSHLH
jgi:hypothetical protein